LLAALLARLLLTATALLAALTWLLARLAGLLSATTLLATLTAVLATLLARFFVRIHSCSIVSPRADNEPMRFRFRALLRGEDDIGLSGAGT
jgi:hypothetical protein